MNRRDFLFGCAAVATYPLLPPTEHQTQFIGMDFGPQYSAIVTAMQRARDDVYEVTGVFRLAPTPAE